MIGKHIQIKEIVGTHEALLFELRFSICTKNLIKSVFRQISLLQIILNHERFFT